MAENSFFLQIFLTNLQEKSHVIWEFLVVKRNPLQSKKVSPLFYDDKTNY